MDDGSSMSDQVKGPTSNAWMPAWLRALWAAGGILIVLLGGIVVGMLIERNSYEDKVILGEEWSELADTIAHVERDSYYRPQDPSEIDEWQEEIEAGAIQGLLGASGDAYAQLLPPAEAARSSARLTGTYEGIGVSIGTSDAGEVQIVSVKLDSPADREDVRVGDVVTAVDATPIPTGDTELAADLLRGDAGTDVSLHLERPGDASVQMELTREEIATGEKTVGYRFFPEYGMAIIQVTLFATTTIDEIDEALQQATADGADRLVLDLRGNPGGWVTAAQAVIGRFLPDSAGPALKEDTRPAGGEMIELPITNDDNSVYGGELIVLVDENTASAAEIVAGALQDHDRATVVGQPSFGKGSVQRVYDYPTGESLRLTIAEWFTPAGQRLQGAGIAPDVTIQVDTSVEEILPSLASIFEGEALPTNATPVASPGASATPSG